MADIDVSTLNSIFRMITPADMLGAQQLAVGKKIDIPILKNLLDIIYGTTGARTAQQMSDQFNELVTGAGESANELKRIISFYKTRKPCIAFGSAPFMATDTDGKTPVENVTFNQIVGKNTNLEECKPQKDMSIIMCKSGFLSPAVRNAERVELFMNAMPSIVVSRMVPYLDVEFAFHRVIPENKSSQTHMWAPSLMKFLLGGDTSQVQDPSSPTSQILDLRENQQFSTGENGAVPSGLLSTAGMEMFTAPQMMMNTSPDANAGRYVDVIDPTRPFMTIESFTVNIQPTVGMYSFKTASLVFKIHDRSRLSEVSDLIRPQVYQDAGSAPTAWITYGWRHPAETGNPYADFINGNMLVREAYKVMNSQFAFDDVGQVTITLQLFTQGLPEMRTTTTSDDGTLGIIKQVEAISKQVQKNRIASGLGSLDGANKEIRPLMLIESAERGTFPSDWSQKEITDALASLKSSLNSHGAKLDQNAVTALLAALNKLYNPKDKNYLDFNKQLESEATHVVNMKFSEVMTGIDPFLPTAAKDAKKKTETNAKPHALTTMIEALNFYNGASEVSLMTAPTNKKVEGFRKKAVSLGKLISVFMAGAFKTIDGIDEMQMYFYQFNDEAGACKSVNIAEFPIEMPVFLDQYRDHVERKGSERVTLEEFLRLVIDSQLHDIRAIGYGFKQFYAPYDPAHKFDPSFKKGVKPEDLELEKGPFKMPAIDMYIETVHASKDGQDNLDKLHQFESPDVLNGDANLGRASQYVRIMRIHIFDKSNNPYKLPGMLLQADDGNGGPQSFYEIPNDANSESFKSVSDITSTWQSIIPTLNSNGTLNPSKGAITNQQIKEYVSKMVPTIIYGTNASSIVSANLASKQDALLATTQMQAQSKGSGKPGTLQPNGSDIGGLPLRVVPASMTMTTFGCPLLSYGQQFFIDFNTGTTIDNMYLITGLTHTITPGKFESNLTLTFYDAYGKFFGAPTAAKYFESIQKPEAKK